MLEARFGKSKAKDVNIHFTYRKGYKQLHHRLSYQNRRAISDMQRVVANAISPVEFDPGWVRKALLRPKNEKHVVWFGWLSDGSLVTDTSTA